VLQVPLFPSFLLHLQVNEFIQGVGLDDHHDHHLDHHLTFPFLALEQLRPMD